MGAVAASYRLHRFLYQSEFEQQIEASGPAESRKGNEPIAPNPRKHSSKVFILRLKS
jgi:hypothetical protein